MLAFHKHLAGFATECRDQRGKGSRAGVSIVHDRSCCLGPGTARARRVRDDRRRVRGHLRHDDVGQQRRADPGCNGDRHRWRLLAEQATEVLFDSTPIGSTTANANGTATTAIVIPVGATSGDHIVVLRGRARGRLHSLSKTVTVHTGGLAFSTMTRTASARSSSQPPCWCASRARCCFVGRSRFAGRRGSTGSMARVETTPDIPGRGLVPYDWSERAARVNPPSPRGSGLASRWAIGAFVAMGAGALVWLAITRLDRLRQPLPLPDGGHYLTDADALLGEGVRPLAHPPAFPALVAATHGLVGPVGQVQIALALSLWLLIVSLYLLCRQFAGVAASVVGAGSAPRSRRSRSCWHGTVARPCWPPPSSPWRWRRRNVGSGRGAPGPPSRWGAPPPARCSLIPSSPWSRSSASECGGWSSSSPCDTPPRSASEGLPSAPRRCALVALPVARSRCPSCSRTTRP